MSSPEYCVFLSGDLKNENLTYRILEIHCANGFIGHIRVTRQPSCYISATAYVWHYEIKDNKITLTGRGEGSVKFLASDGVAELAHVTVTNWELRE